MGHRRPPILCDPIRHFRDTLWLLFPQTSALTHANRHTHTHTCIPLNRPVRQCWMHSFTDQKRHWDMKKQRWRSVKRGKRVKKGRGETDRKRNKEKVRKTKRPGLREKERERDRTVLKAARCLFAAWEQACPTISLCPLQLYKAWETFYSSNHSDPLGFYSISGCLRIVFHYCFYI